MLRRDDVTWRLFQARMWREYAMRWDDSFFRPWVENTLRMSRDDCLRRSKVNAYLARRANRATTLKSP